ncbi:hypothetical protein J6TS7_19690 [Paenibacillus dendritiformis]|uniref:hypothetical protein n=1 Tax=Paenibacillus melissococcoides TaxID=2912268 RepID=UPI001B07FB13|nr:hypothetical protein [Paenibacillus melissococcoides]GIO78359.1 hypothetical protein J6TS7_19690 [Paenibacillus dendritiformis]
MDALRQHVTSEDGMKRLESLRASIVAERDQLQDQLRSLEQPGYDLPLEAFIEAVADDWIRQEGVPVSFRKLGSAYPVDQDTQHCTVVHGRHWPMPVGTAKRVLST